MEKVEITSRLPFSNNTEAEFWKGNNCDTCNNYESESVLRSKAKCKYAYDIDKSYVTGEIPVSTLNYFGFAKKYVLANCPRKHCGRIHSFDDYQKELEKEKKEGRIQFKFD